MPNREQEKQARKVIARLHGWGWTADQIRGCLRHNYGIALPIATINRITRSIRAHNVTKGD